MIYRIKRFSNLDKESEDLYDKLKSINDKKGIKSGVCSGKNSKPDSYNPILNYIHTKSKDAATYAHESGHAHYYIDKDANWLGKFAHNHYNSIGKNITNKINNKISIRNLENIDKNKKIIPHLPKYSSDILDTTGSLLNGYLIGRHAEKLKHEGKKEGIVHRLSGHIVFLL